MKPEVRVVVVDTAKRLAARMGCEFVPHEPMSKAEAAYRAAWAQASVDPMFRGTVDAGWQEWKAYRDYLATQGDR